MYLGEWKGEKMHGKGVLEYGPPFHTSYEGQWKGGMRHGNGVVYSGENGEVHGEWKNGILKKGTLKWRVYSQKKEYKTVEGCFE